MKASIYNNYGDDDIKIYFMFVNNQFLPSNYALGFIGFIVYSLEKKCF